MIFAKNTYSFMKYTERKGDMNMETTYTLYKIGFIIGVLGMIISIAGVMLEVTTIIPSLICLAVATVLVTISMIIEDKYLED